jgi:hypothetical protein
MQISRLAKISSAALLILLAVPSGYGGSQIDTFTADSRKHPAFGECVTEPHQFHLTA